jgi:hypothetical protein
MAKNVEFTYDIYMSAPAAKVWKEIVDGEMTKHYVYGTGLESKTGEGRSVFLRGRWRLQCRRWGDPRD